MEIKQNNSIYYLNQYTARIVFNNQEHIAFVNRLQKSYQQI